MEPSTNESITAELRKWISSLYTDGIYIDSMGRSSFDELAAIADRIDAEHERMAYDYQHEFDGWKADRDARWVQLPLDADGAPIHVGDELSGYGRPNGVVYCKAVTECMVLVGEKDEGYRQWLLWSADECRHIKPDSWERIIKDAKNQADAAARGQTLIDSFRFTDEQLIERCRKLAGDAE